MMAQPHSPLNCFLMGYSHIQNCPHHRHHYYCKLPNQYRHSLLVGVLDMEVEKVVLVVEIVEKTAVE